MHRFSVNILDRRQRQYGDIYLAAEGATCGKNMRIVSFPKETPDIPYIYPCECSQGTSFLL